MICEIGNDLRLSISLFPLTLALSLGERESATPAAILAMQGWEFGKFLKCWLQNADEEMETCRQPKPALLFCEF